MRTPCATLAAVLVTLVAVHGSLADEERVLCGFDEPGDLRAWDFPGGTPRLMDLDAGRALEIVFDPAGRYHPAYLVSHRLPGDWSGFDELALDVHNPLPRPIPATVLVADRAWAGKGRTYWNRHNAHVTLPPGRTTWRIPVQGLYRGEAGSRNNDIKSNINPAQIVRVDFGFGRKGTTGRVVIDNLRLVRKPARPAGVRAFDFGPPEQALMPGWTPVTHDTAYAPARGYGWGPGGGHPWPGAARDVTFGPPLIRDFCECGGYRFSIRCPPGRYRIAVTYENSGYWGDQQARHTLRRILVNGREAWREDRSDGAAHCLFRFEDVDFAGGDIWNIFMAPELVRPAVFEVDLDAPPLTIQFECDRVWGNKVSAITVVPAGSAPAADWIGAQRETLAEAFRDAAVCLDPPAAAFTPSAAAPRSGLLAWAADIDDDVAPYSVPSDTTGTTTIRRRVARGEFEPLCLALRPLRDLGTVRVDLAPFEPRGVIEARVDLVYYLARRGFGNLAWRTVPHTLRPCRNVELRKGVTRELIVTARVPRDTPPGRYTSSLSVLDPAGNSLAAAQLVLQVEPVTLSRETPFLMGFFGVLPPDGFFSDSVEAALLEQTLALLREHGMNALSGGPDWRLTGWKDGRPLLDCAETDRFFAACRRHGFSRPVYGYGLRFAGLHRGYTPGAVRKTVEQQSGLPYEQAFVLAWRALAKHASAHHWPPIFYNLCDETRVRTQAEAELEFMRLMQSVSARIPDRIRTAGSYSVTFTERPSNRNNMLYWHQRFFELLDVSSLNRHDASVLEQASAGGKTVHIYNQGLGRYSFGPYQWSEHRKGVAARWQWHLNIIHGYQFFDLDGREPDTAMIAYGRDRIYPTLAFERCREGAELFYLMQTAWNRAQANDAPVAAARRAREALQGLADAIETGQRTPPPEFPSPDALKNRVIDLLLEMSP